MNGFKGDDEELNEFKFKEKEKSGGSNQEEID
jgi:hypothetical protein